MTIAWPPAADTLLPTGHDRAVLVGRVMSADGPCVVTVRGGRLIDITARVATVRDLAEYDEPAAFVRECDGPDLGSLAEIAAHTRRNSGGRGSRGCSVRSTCNRSRPRVSPSWSP